jgi:UDP-N-acetylmuramoyl-tripeptide--D-alanyl-D-alanine ligase
VSFTLGQLARDCGGTLRGDAETRVSGVSSDTRLLEPNQLFIAIRGTAFDGHQFVAEAVAKGARAVLVSSDGVDAGNAAVIRVEDTVLALGSLAKAHRSRFQGPVIAVTGSNGKTTTKEMCASILEAAGHRVRRSPGNYNNEIGLPLSILGLVADDNVLVVELGMNHPGEIDALGAIASPTVGAITQIAPAHLGPMGSVEAIASAKGELLERIRSEGVAVLNADDPLVMGQAGRFSGRVVRFGTGPEAEVRAGSIEPTAVGTRFELATGRGSTEIELHTPGRHQVWNALCAVAAAAAADAADAPDARLLAAARSGLARFRPVAGRLVLSRTASGITLLDDSYNANPVSVEAALRALAEIEGAARRIAILGDMLELGPEGSDLHAQTGSAAAHAGVDLLVTVGELSRETASAARRGGIEEIVEVSDAKAAASFLRSCVRSGDAVLVKGSRGMKLEAVVRALTGEDS